MGLVTVRTNTAVITFGSQKVTPNRHQVPQPWETVLLCLALSLLVCFTWMDSCGICPLLGVMFLKTT